MHGCSLPASQLTGGLRANASVSVICSPVFFWVNSGSQKVERARWRLKRGSISSPWERTPGRPEAEGQPTTPPSLPWPAGWWSEVRMRVRAPSPPPPTPIPATEGTWPGRAQCKKWGRSPLWLSLSLKLCIRFLGRFCERFLPKALSHDTVIFDVRRVMQLVTFQNSHLEMEPRFQKRFCKSANKS